MKTAGTFSIHLLAVRYIIIDYRLVKYFRFVLSLFFFFSFFFFLRDKAAFCLRVSKRSKYYSKSEDIPAPRYSAEEIFT